ncbi:TonB family protein [Noviherbaspirillum saxi]|uniref:TonB family protein n=2 Tax=Noviherbaspirillum saxi TaxID=2320863 RepID=A0A3A3FH04_9BURK|nr:TonB family protein [Noviherbaspirillum saxi]
MHIAAMLWITLPVAAQNVTTDSGSLPSVLKPPLYFYPDEARNKGEQGTVIVRSLIDEEGYVRTAEVVESSGSKSLDQAAVIAVRYAQYSPILVAGAPTPTHIRVPIKFDLTTPPDPSAAPARPEGARMTMKDTRPLGARIKANINFTVPASWERNDPAEYEITLKPNGMLYSATLLKSSGLPLFDKAVGDAIASIQPFPTTEDGAFPTKIILVARPKEQ